MRTYCTVEGMLLSTLRSSNRDGNTKQRDKYICTADSLSRTSETTQHCKAIILQ